MFAGFQILRPPDPPDPVEAMRCGCRQKQMANANPVKKMGIANLLRIWRTLA